MRYIALIAFVSLPLFAQPQRREPPVQRPNELMMIERYESRLHDLALGVKRDAFIVSRVVDGSGALNDFQKINAMQKAIDSVDAAIRRANEDPPASPFTQTALSQTHDALIHGREQGSIADTVALQKLMIDKTHPIYVELFKELYMAQRERQALVDVQTTLAQINQDIDSAMVEALGSSFEFVRAGGK